MTVKIKSIKLRKWLWHYNCARCVSVCVHSAYPSGRQSHQQVADRFPWQTATVSFSSRCPSPSQTVKTSLHVKKKKLNKSYINLFLRVFTPKFPRVFIILQVLTISGLWATKKGDLLSRCTAVLFTYSHVRSGQSEKVFGPCRLCCSVYIPTCQNHRICLLLRA